MPCLQEPPVITVKPVSHQQSLVGAEVMMGMEVGRAGDGTRKGDEVMDKACDPGREAWTVLSR